MKRKLFIYISAIIALSMIAGSICGCHNSSGSSEATSSVVQSDNSGDGSEINSGNGSDDNSGDGSENNSGDGSENNSGSGSENNSGSGSENNSGSGSENNSGSGSENNSGDGSENNSGNGSENNSGNGSENNSENGSENNSGNGSENNSGNGSENNSGNKTEESTAATTPAPVITTPTPVVTTPAPETTTPAPATTPAPVTTTPAPVTTTTLWSEQQVNQTFYITVDCYSRSKGMVGAPSVSYMKAGTKVLAIAKTNTGYYKLADGSFVHGDYLSTVKPAVTTTAPQTKPPQTPAPQTNPPQTNPPQTAAPQTPPPQTEPPQGNFVAPDGSVPSVVIDKGVSVLTDIAVNCTKEEAEVFRLVNLRRAENGLQPLMWDSAAYQVAKTRSSEITEVFSHARPNGEKPYSLYPFDKWDYMSAVGENIAAGQRTPDDVMEAWMNSSGHRGNILSQDYECIAISFLHYKEGAYRYYWVQQFTAYLR